MPEIQLKYAPRDAFIPFHTRSQRWAVLVCHRRAGKTVACVNDLVTRAVYTSKKNARYGYIAPFYRQAKDVAWVYLKEAVEGLTTKIFESTLTVELFNGAKISLYGADNPDALRGVYFDGVIVDEFGDCRPSLWGEVLLPTLADRQGWAVFIGTPKGKNHFHAMYNRAIEESGWYDMILKASESGLLPAEELAEMRLQMDEDQYQQEFECSFDAAVKGTYYASTLAKLDQAEQIIDVPWDADQPVDVFTDLGFTDSSAYWFVQRRPDGWAVIDYEEAHSQPLEYYFNLLRFKQYDYGDVWLPHDAKAKTLQTGRSTIEQFRDAGFSVRVAPRLKVQHGIDAVRMVLPKCWFDKAQTAEGVEGLRAYQRRWDEVTKTYSDSPMHNWASHPADAFRQFALVAKELKLADSPKPDPLEELLTPPKLTLDKLFKEHDRAISMSRRFGGRIH